MTKLEEKLQELGYECNKWVGEYRKSFTDYLYLIIDIYEGEVNELCSGIKLRKEIFILDKIMLNMIIELEKQAFDEMKKDLEILKECECK